MQKYFSKDYVIPSPRLTKHQEKKSSPEIEVFFLPKLGEDPSKKKGFRRKLKCFFSELGLFCLIIQSAQISMGGHLNLDGGTLNLAGGTLTLDGGTLTLDGGMRPPYNLSTGYSLVNILNRAVCIPSATD